MKLTVAITIAIIAGCILVASRTLTIFVVPPIGAIPEGRTVVITRLNKTEFIDSADAFCYRETGKVTLLCRGFALGAIAKETTIIGRFPYSKTLHTLADRDIP